MPDAYAGIVDQYIDRSHTLDRFGDRRLYLLEIRDVGVYYAGESG